MGGHPNFNLSGLLAQAAGVPTHNCSACDALLTPNDDTRICTHCGKHGCHVCMSDSYRLLNASVDGPLYWSAAYFYHQEGIC